MPELTTNVDKAKLLTSLKANRTGHAARYEKARRGYLRTTKAKLSDLLTRVVDDELLERVWLDAPPEDHTSDYDDAIAMMEWSTDEIVQLTQGQFKQYVQDDWGWKEQWLTSNTAYLNNA